ncbi:MAG: dTDP-4-dehydrorhamnose reductase [Solirubrobacteraceae bacterium]
MRILLTGGLGKLAHDVIQAGARGGHELVPVDLPELDITDAAAVQALLERLEDEPGGLDGVINCAAWTDVDGAEAEQAAAHAVNAVGAGVLAERAAEARGGAGVPMIHISTDYVFDGNPPLDSDRRPRPYVESDPTDPQSVYGTTKLEGERRVLSASRKHAVVRTAWLYGVHGPDFPATMLRLAGEREAVQVVTDQVGSPTWAGHLAPAVIGLLERGVRGLVHSTNGGHVSWNGFTQEIYRQAEIACRVEPTTSGEFVRPAPRPAWSALESEREDVIPLPPWQDGLAGYLAARDGISR